MGPIGDHANILSLEFPVVWAAESFVSQVGSIVEDYSASVDIEDKLCNAGFAEVRLSARRMMDRHIQESRHGLDERMFLALCSKFHCSHLRKRSRLKMRTLAL